MTQPSTDPFAGGDTNPSLSFKDASFGTTYSGTVAELPTAMQGRDFDSGDPAFWPDGNPKIVVCTTLDINGDKWNLWAAKPSAMFAAIKDAQQAAGAQIAVGGTLTVTYTHDKPNEKNPRLNAAKQYKVVYEPPNMFGDGQQPQQAAPQPQAPPVAPARRSDEELAQLPPQPVVQQAPAQQAPAQQAPAQQAPAQQAPPQQPAQQAPAPVQQAPAAAGQPTPQQIAGVKAAGLDPAQIFPGYVDQAS